MTRRRTILASLLALGAAALALAGCGGGGGGGSSVNVEGVQETIALFKGIPQDGITLGRPSAPVTLVEFADLQCPYCGEWARDTLPTLVDEYVRPGKVKIVFRGLHFVGDDSETALRAAISAGQQDKLWQVVDLLYRNQGEENKGWVTDGLLRSIGQSVPGLDADKMMAGMNDDVVTAAMQQADAQATQAGVEGTPTFFVGRGKNLRQLTIQSLAPDAFRPALDELIAES